MAAKKRIFRRFFALYASFLIFLLLLLVPSYQRSIKEVENRTLETMSAVLAAGMERLEDSFYIASTAARTLYEDQRIFSLFYLTSFQDPTDVYKIKQGLEEYKNITMSIPLLKDSGLFMRNDSLIASGRYFQSYRDAYVSPFLYSVDHPTWDEWVSHLSLKGKAYSLSSMNLTTSNGTRPVLIFSAPLPLNTGNSNAFFYAVYDQDELLDLLLLPSYESSCSLVLSSTGQELISYAPIDFKDTVTVTHNAARYQLSVTVKIDTAVFSREMAYFRNYIIIGMCIYFLVAIILAAAYSWRNARPVVRVIQAAEKKGQEAGMSLPNAPITTYKDSYEYIHALIDQMGTEVVNSKTTLSEQITQLKESSFERLLRGDYYQGDLQVFAQKYFPHFPACCRMILIKSIPEGNADITVLSAIQMQLLDSLQRILPANAITHALPNQAFNQTVVLLPCEPDSPRSQCELLFNHLNAALGEIVNLKFSVSAPFSGMDKISSVFQQLRHLLRLSGNKGENVLYALDNPWVLQSPKGASAAKFYDMLIRGEMDVALALMSQDVAELKALGMVHDIEVQQLFFVYRHALSQAQSEIPGADILGPLPEYPAQLSVNEVFEKLADRCRALCHHISTQRQSSEENFERKILHFIQDRLNNSDLCIRMVTDEFSISESNLRRILLKITSTTFQDYVEAQRMALAQQLLSCSDMPVGQIPSHCGYASSNSFYKAFRRRFNLTPTAMREQARGNNP
ncbi:MAG: helix-turn-helix transcriptional regulator [Clostridiales bacterium]|nr:helix-turn-helix transcriptional regulator [Clostridiales bacterium]